MLSPFRRHLVLFVPLLFCLALPAPGSDLPPAGDVWLRVETAHFTLYGNASESKIRNVGLDLERLRAVLLRMGGKLSAHSPVPTAVYVFQSDASLLAYKPRVDGRPRSLSAYFLPSRTVTSSP